MDKFQIGLLAMSAGIFLIALRIQIGVALGIVSFFGIAAILGWRPAWGIVTAIPFNFVGDWNLTAIPMFLLMGYIAFATKLTAGLFQAMRVVLSRLPGGLAMASVAACAFLSAASGSSVAVSAAMARIATPEMLKYRYDPGLAAGVIASAGTLGSMIPPSLLMVLYGYFAEISVAKMFMAGFVPGILSALMFAAMIFIRVRLNPALAPAVHETFDEVEKKAALTNVWPLPVLIIGTLVGIFIGWFTPTEGAAVGAAIAVLLAWIKGTLSRDAMKEAIVSTLSGTSSIFMVVIGTALLAKMTALTGLPDGIGQWLFSFGNDQTTFMIVVVILYLILGCFLDSVSILLLTMPIMLPLAREVGVDLIWFGIVLIKLLEIGLVTPPVGLNVFVMKSALGNLIPLTTIFRGVTWFVATDAITLTIIILFPWLSLVLPSMMD